MTKLSRFDREALSSWQAEAKLYAQGELTEAMREHLRNLLQMSLEVEINQRLGAPRYVRTVKRTDWRNGYRRRDLVTAMGLLKGLRVPRSRKDTYEPKVFARYSRRQPLVNELIQEMFLAGVATRRVGEILQAVLGEAPSATTVSRIARALDQKVREYHHRPLKDRWPFLMLDAVTMSVKGACGLKKRRVLVVLAMDEKGNRELLEFLLADGESEADWSALLEALRKRGLSGKALRLVITDGAAGLAAALRLVYPHAKHQRCWVHKLRNVANCVRKRDEKEVMAGARAIYQADTRRAALVAFRRWRDRWQTLYPKAVACLEKDLEALLQCFDYPAKLRPKIRTTNAIERAFREVRRRTRPMSAFTNDQSCERIVYALIQHLNTQWSRRPLK